MADYEITAPDGKVYRISAPEGATEDQIIGYAKQHMAQAAPETDPGKVVFDRRKPAAQNPPSEPWTNSADRDIFASTANAVAGIGEGLAMVPDMLAQGAGYLLAEGGDLVGLPEWITDELRDPATIGGGIESLVPKPTQGVPRLMRSVAEGVGGALGGLGVGKALTAAAPAGRSVSRSVGELLGAMPGQQLAAGGVAGGATEGARQLGAPMPVQIGAGIVAGGLTPSALRGTAGAVDAMIDPLTDPGVNRAAAQFVRGNMIKPEHEVLADLDSAAPGASGARPTLAEVTLDPGLAAMQRGVGNLSGTNGGRISERVNQNARTRMEAIDGTLGPGNPADIERAAAARERSLNALTASSIGEVGPLVAPDVAGAAARGYLSQGYQAARARTANAYDSPILQENPPIALRPLERADIEVPTYGDTRKLDDFQDQAVRGYRSALPAKPKTLLEFVRLRGGVAADSMGADDLRSAGMDAKGQPTLVREGGVALDRLREAAEEAGYIDDRVDLGEFSSLLQAEYAGAAPLHALNDLTDVAAYDEALDARNFWRRQFDERELDPAKMTNDQWVRFYQDVEGPAAGSQPRTLDDLERERTPGSLMGPFQQTVASLRQRFFGDGGTEASAPVRALFDDVLNADEVPLKTLEGWERRALDLAAAAPDRTTGASLQALSRAIGARASMAGGPERREALEAARGVRRQQGEVFEDGAVGRALDRGDYGRFALPDAEIGRTLVPRGRAGGEVVDQVQRAVGTRAEEIARAEIRRALEDAADDPRAIARVARDYGESVSRFPALERDIRTARGNAALSSRFRSTQLGQFLRDNTDPAQAVSRLLTVKDGGRAFQALVNGPNMSPTALAGVRRGIAEHIRAMSRSSTVDSNLQTVPVTRKMGDGIVQALERTRGTTALAPAQRKMLNLVRHELKREQFAKSTNRPSGSDTARNVGMSMKAFQLAMEVMPGSGPARSILQAIFRHEANVEKIFDVVTDAVLDPKFAAELLRRPTADRLNRVLSGARAYNQAATLGATASAD